MLSLPRWGGGGVEVDASYLPKRLQVKAPSACRSKKFYDFFFSAHLKFLHVYNIFILFIFLVLILNKAASRVQISKCIIRCPLKSLPPTQLLSSPKWQVLPLLLMEKYLCLYIAKTYFFLFFPCPEGSKFYTLFCTLLLPFNSVSWRSLYISLWRVLSLLFFLVAAQSSSVWMNHNPL